MACLPCDENQDVIDIGPTAAVPETTTSSEPTTATIKTTTTTTTTVKLYIVVASSLPQLEILIKVTRLWGL